MKNTHDPFDDELKNRLTNYSEEPDDKLWSGIASNIETVKPPFAWAKWLSMGSLVIIITGAVLYFSLNDTINEEIVEAASASITEATKNGSPEASSPSPPSASQETQTASESSSDDNQEKTSAVAAGDDVNAERVHSPSSLVERQSGKSFAPRVDEQNRKNVSGSNQRSNSNRTDANEVADSPTQILNPQTERNNLGATSTQTSPSLQQNRLAEKSLIDGVNNGNRSELKDQVVTNTESQSQTLKNDDVTPPQKSEQTKNSEDVNVAGADSPALAQGSEIRKEEKREEEAEEKKDLKVNVASADEDKKEDKPKTNRKLSLYLTAMPTFGYQRIEANQNDNVFIESISKVSNFSTKRLGVRAEVGAEYALTPKFRAFGGILYYQRKQTIDYVERVPVNGVGETDIDTLVIIEPQFASTSRTFEYELRNIGIQLGVNYVLKEKKFLHTMGTGIEFHKALNKLPQDQQALGFSSNPSTYVFANLYYRLQYPAQGKLRAIFQPTFNYSLYLNQDMNAPFFVKPYGLGLNVGMTYHF